MLLLKFFDLFFFGIQLLAVAASVAKSLVTFKRKGFETHNRILNELKFQVKQKFLSDTMELKSVFLPERLRTSILQTITDFGKRLKSPSEIKSSRFNNAIAFTEDVKTFPMY